MLPTDIVKRQEGLLNLIHMYESMDRKVIKQNVKNALKRRYIKLIEVCKDLDMEYNKVKQWIYMGVNNIPTLKDALALAEFYHFSISEIIPLADKESSPKTDQSIFFHIISKYSSTDRLLIKKNLKLSLKNLKITPQNIQQDLNISIYKVRWWVCNFKNGIPLLKDALALCNFYNLNILDFCKNTF